jgi:hypothetical protein
MHDLRPKLQDTQIGVFQLEKPNMILVTFDSQQGLTREIMELYFSNYKRSSGGEILNLVMQNNQPWCSIKFKDYRSIFSKTNKLKFLLIIFNLSFFIAFIKLLNECLRNIIR